jgi:CheY-like chemotaxis protein
MGDSRQGALTGLHILVVEDDTDGRVILKSLLGYFGALVTAVSGVRDAARELRHVAPDVVIADMILGRGTAFGLVADARRRGSRIPFIAISEQDYDPRELEAAGFAVYLRKPLDHNKLVDTILAVVRRR